MLYLQKFDKILIETGQFSDIIRVTENGLVPGVDSAQNALYAWCSFPFVLGVNTCINSKIIRMIP